MKRFLQPTNAIEEAKTPEEMAAALLARAEKADAAPVSDKQGTDAGGRPLPNRLHPAADYAFRCVFPYGKRLAECMVRTGSLGDTAIVDFLPDGLVMRQMESFGSCSAELQLPAAGWSAWSVPDNGCTRVFFYEQLESLAKLTKPDTCLSLYALKSEQDFVWARLYGKGVDRRVRLALKSTNQLGRVPVLPHATWQYPWHVELPSKTFKEEIDCCDKNKAALVEFGIRTDTAPASLELITFNDATAAATTTYQSILAATSVEGTQPEDPPVIRFSVTFLTLLAKIDQVATTVTLSGGLEHHPLRIVFTVAGPGSAGTLGTITTLLAETVQ